MTHDDSKTEEEYPCYPHPLIRNIKDEDKPAPYDGDLNDLNARKNHKLSQIWLSWSDLRKNDKLCKLLQKEGDDNDTIKELKYILVLFMDRLARILCETNLFEEIGQ